MDVERLKRLNTLAGELKGQGIVANYEDAAYLATAIHGREPEACLAGIHPSESQSLMMQEIIEHHPVPEEKLVVGGKSEKPVLQGMAREEVERILQVFADQVSKECNILQARLERAEAAIEQLKSNNSQKPEQRTLPMSPMVETVIESKSAPPQIKQAYTSEDVSVEKMFYFGKK